MTYIESEQLALPIECTECGDNKIVNCFCDWRKVLLPSPTPFKRIEKYLRSPKVPHSFERIEIAPGVRAIKYKY